MATTPAVRPVYLVSITYPDDTNEHVRATTLEELANTITRQAWCRNHGCPQALAVMIVRIEEPG